MAKWDFKIVGASFVKELVPIADDVQPRSQSFMQPSFHLEGGKIVMKESGQYVTAIYFPQIGEIDGVAPTDIDDAYAKLLTLVENFNGGGGTPQNLTQVITQGDILPYTIPIPNNTFITFDLGRELTENYFTTDDVGTGGVFLDKDVIFPDNATIRFQAGYVEDNVSPINLRLLPYRFTTDAYVFYQGARVTDMVLQPNDVCTLKWDGENSTDGSQIWHLTIVSKSIDQSISTAKIINRCPSNAFRNAHGNLAIGNSWYLGTRGDVSTPSAMVYFPDLNDLSTYQKVSMSSTTLGGIEYLAYNETLGKIYSCLNGNKLLVFNDITDVSDYTIIDLTLSAGVVRAGAVVMTDDAHIYIGTNGVTNSHFIKLDATDYSEVTVTEWTGRPSIHSGTWNADKSTLRFCQNGGVCYRALINPTDMTFTEKFVGDSITDDIVYCANIFSYGFFDAVFYPSENRLLGTKGGFIENPDTEEIYAVDVMPSYTAFWDETNGTLTLGTIDGSIEVFSGENLTGSALGYVNPNRASDVYTNLDDNKFNELNKIGDRYFATIWNNDVSFGADGLGACVELELNFVKNASISKTEKIYRTDMYLKKQVQTSVTAASFIDVDFTLGDWSTMPNKDYGVSLTPNNSASGAAIVGWSLSNKLSNSFRLNFASPVTATLDLTIIINP